VFVDFIRFWWHCLLEGWHIGEGCFAWIEGICFLVAAGLHWRGHRQRKAWEDKWEPKILKAAFAIFSISFLVSTVFIAPFLQFRDSEKERKSAVNEVARLTPTGSGDAPYQTLAKELTSAKAEAEKERKAKIKAEGEAEYYRKQGIAWLLASSNTSTAIPVLDDAIAAAKREPDAASTNTRPRISTLLQRETEVNKLEGRRAIEEERKKSAQYFTMVSYAISAYRERFSEPVTKCGGTIDPLPNIPTLDWWVMRDGIRTNIVSTNCDMRFEYSFWAKGDLNTIISIQGKNASSRAEFNLSNEPYFYSKLYITNKLFFYRKSGPQDATNCIKDMNYILDLFLDSQKEAFQ